MFHRFDFLDFLDSVNFVQLHVSPYKGIADAAGRDCHMCVSKTDLFKKGTLPNGHFLGVLL